jgi:MFS transporter, AAHS family, 4-hydroxybenzoate transporter
MENPATPLYKQRMTKVHYSILAICFLMNMCDGMDVMVISYTANSIIKEWHITPANFGFVFSAGLMGMAVGAMFLASLADIFGRKPLILITACCMGAGIFLTGYVHSIEQLIAFRFISGLFIGCMLACTSAMAAEYATEKTKNFWVSAVMSGYPVGAVLSGLAANNLIVNYGWRAMYFFAGITTLLTIPFIFFLLKESLEFLYKKQPANALQKVNSILAAMKSAPAIILPEKAINTNKTAVTSLFSSDKKKVTLILWVAFFLSFAVLYFLTSWIPKLASIAGLSDKLSIYSGIFFNLGAFTGIITQGWLSAKFGLRKVICYFLLSTALLMMLFGFFSGSFLLLLFCLIGFGIQGGFIGLYAVAARIYPTEIRSTGIGWAIGFGRLGAIIGPFIGGFLISSGTSLSLSFIAFAILVIVAGIITLFIKSPGVS